MSAPIIRVVDISRVRRGDGVELSAAVRGLPFPLRDYRLFFRIPGELADCVPENGDPFVPALLLPAMQAHRDLVIDAPVSPELVEGARAISAQVADWFTPFRAARVVAPIRASASESLDRFAAFFTGGVDSFHTVLKRRPAGQRISHLLYIAGFDVPLASRRLTKRVVHLLRRAAADLGRTLSVIETNLRQLTDSFLSWANYFSSGLASVAHALGLGFRRVHMSSHMPNVSIIPWGSHAIVFPGWSGRTLDLTYDQDGLTRTDKLRATVVRSPIALRHLRVCWQNTGSDMNCGRCEKCLRTKLALLAEGVLDQCATFDSEFDIGLLDDPRHVSCVSSCFPEILASLEASDAPAETVEAVKRLMDRPYPRGEDVATGRLLDRYGEHRLHGWLRRVRGWAQGV